MGTMDPVRRELEARARIASVLFADRMADYLEHTEPVRTGELLHRTNVRPLSVGRDRIRWRVTLSAPHSRYVVEGTRPHVIRPRRRGGVLVFYWPKVGRTVFAREVHHPGTKPHRFWRDALAMAGRLMSAAWSDAGVGR